MSNDVNDVSLDDVSANLRSYGRWLEARSDVELGAADVELLDEVDDEHLEPSRGPRLLAGIVAAMALVALVAVGLGFGGDPEGDAEQVEAGPAGAGGVETDERTGDSPTSETGRQERPAVGTDADRTSAPDGAAVGTADGAAGATDQADPGDGNTPAASADDATDQSAEVSGGDTSDTDANAPVDVGTDSDGDEASDAAATPSTAASGDGGDGDGHPPWTGPAAGSSGFVSPTNGAVLDLNAMNTLQAAPVAGAASYVFEGWQDGVNVLSVSGDGPSIVLPSRLITAGMTSQIQPGAMRLTVSARDSAGNVMSTSEIEVMVAGAGGVTGRDVMGDNPFPTNP